MTYRYDLHHTTLILGCLLLAGCLAFAPRITIGEETVSGCIVDRESGEPLADVMVHLSYSSASVSPPVYDGGQATTGENGCFELVPTPQQVKLYPDDVLMSLKAEKGGYKPVWVSRKRLGEDWRIEKIPLPPAP